MSLKGDKYENAEEVKFRLEGSVVLYEGRPVYINKVSVPGADDVAEIARVYFYELPLKPKNNEVRKYLSSKKFDLTPFRMGYMNHKEGTVFVMRSPVRQHKQGFSVNSSKILDVSGQRLGWLGFNNMIHDQGFVDMVNGVYPDFKTAGDIIEEGKRESIAISPSFALTLDKDLDVLVLFNKGTKCGLAFKGDKNIRVSKKFHFLKEEMEQYRIPVA